MTAIQSEDEKLLNRVEERLDAGDDDFLAPSEVKSLLRLARLGWAAEKAGQ